VQKETDKLGKIFQADKEKEYEIKILNHLLENQRIDSSYFSAHREEYAKISEALKYLISENLIRATSSSKARSYYEFHSPKYRIGMKILKEKEAKKKGTKQP